MRIQETIAAFLSAQSQHEAAKEALVSGHRNEWVKLGEEAIRTAPEHNRTHVAHSIKYALDSPQWGGPGLAEDFLIKPEPHPFKPETLYRAWKVNTNPRALVDMELVSPDPEILKRRLIAMYVVRAVIVQMEGERASN
jgi:hypothetical protein